MIRRELRLGDHPALDAAASAAAPVIPLFVRDRQVQEGLGAASRWRLEQGLAAFDQRLRTVGSRLILRSGDQAEVLADLAAETGARDVFVTRYWTRQQVSTDRDLCARLARIGITLRVFRGQLLHDPESLFNRSGGFFKVFTPFWKAFGMREIGLPASAPSRLAAPDRWPLSEALAGWRLGKAMQRGARVVAAHTQAGEESAIARLNQFLERQVEGYALRRDLLGMSATSGLSDSLAWGEISPRTCWNAALNRRVAAAWGQPATGGSEGEGVDAFMRQLAWREFAWHLAWHTPRLLHDNWRPEWDGFSWQGDCEHPHVQAWQRGRTGVPLVDAAMRELHATGRMHNRARMIVANYLTRHLLTHWRVGLRWFADTLTDLDEASNALGWQWAAGSGPDAAPYFRIFNPELQAGKFDVQGEYRRRWLAEPFASPSPTALSWFEGIPHSWNLRPDDPYPPPLITHEQGRRRALAAHTAVRASKPTVTRAAGVQS